MAVHSKYQPFSFQERMTPFLMLQEQYDKLNETIATLGDQANQYYQFLDPAAKEQVDAYNAELSDIAGKISTEGMKTINRNTLHALRREYSSKILPIQQAAQTAGVMQNQIREMQMKDPTLMVQSIPTATELMQNPGARPKVVSGIQLASEGKNAALTLPDVTYAQMSAYMNGDTSAIPDLESASQRIADTYGISTDQAMQYIQRGILTGLGERTTQLVEREKEKAIDHEFQMKMARYNAEVSAANSQRSIDAQFLMSGWTVDPSKTDFNERYKFDPVQAAQIVQSGIKGSRSSSKATSVDKEAVENYRPIKTPHLIGHTGVMVADGDDVKTSRSVTHGKFKHDPITTDGLKTLPPEQIMAIFNAIGVVVDPQDFMTGSGSTIDYDDMIDAYAPYLNLYEFTKHEDTNTSDKKKRESDWMTVEIRPRGSNTKVTTSKRKEEIAAGAGILVESDGSNDLSEETEEES